MTVMEYMARFTELARFSDDYVATDMTKVRRFENGLVVHSRQDCRPPPIKHGLFGLDRSGHRERDRGCTEYLSCGY